MDLGNLATVICPSILYARGRDAMRDETFGALRVITALLENQDEFFTVPEEFLGILHDQDYFSNSMELPGKEFMKKCDTYMKLKASNGRSQPGTPYNNNHSYPRYPPLQSPMSERPHMGPSASERTTRPHASMPQPNTYPPPGSPSPPQNMIPNPSPRIPPVDDWSSPRPPNAGTPSTRPTSFAQPPRPSTDHTFSPTNTNGYPSAVRQRT